MEEKISNILDLFPNLTITTVERVLNDNNNNVEQSIEYLLNNGDNINQINNNSSNLDNCGKGFDSSNYSNNGVDQIKTLEDEENERLFKEFMKNEEKQNEISNRSKTHNCEICLMDLPIEDFYILDECEHRFCTNCLNLHITFQVRSGYPNVKCPVRNCRYITSYDECKQLLSKEVFERYDRLLLNSHLQNDKNVYTCPQGDCGFKMVVSNKNDRYVTCLNADCGFSFCVECREEAHHELSCAEFAELKVELAEYLIRDQIAEKERQELWEQSKILSYGKLDRKTKGKIQKRIYFMGKSIKDFQSLQKFMNDIKKTSDRTYNYIKEHCSICPHCFGLVEKSYGCNDMLCYCGKYFCFGCGIKRSEHYRSYPCG